MCQALEQVPLNVLPHLSSKQPSEVGTIIIPKLQTGAKILEGFGNLRRATNTVSGKARTWTQVCLISTLVLLTL